MTTFTAMANQKGRTFAAVLIRQGDRYGVNASLVHDDPRPLIEFWDLTHPHDLISPWGMRYTGQQVWGQFTGGRYYLDTLMGREEWADGICLDGGNAQVWSIDAPTLHRMLTFIDNCAREGVGT